MRGIAMQKIVRFYVKNGTNIDADIQDYLDDNDGESIVTLTTCRNAGDEIVIAVVDDGQ